MAKNKVQLTSPKYGKTAGGASGGGVLTGSRVSYGAPSSDYHQQAKDAAARGDWDAVNSALKARQAKIDREGGNDRGASNQQILSQLQSQYGGSALSPGRQDAVRLSAGEKLPFETNYASGTVYKDKGWADGVDYLDRAQRLAAAGDLDGAHEALMRRGFKMADTGSQGGGTSQDQAYAQIQQLYNQTPAARAQYENEVAVNRQRLAEHPTQFGTGTNPSLANRRFVSQDGKYLILYDQSGTPSVALPYKENYTKYSPEEIDLMSRYYNGDENTDFAELYRQIHNNQVVRTGTGRLIGRDGNFASGTPISPVSARDWTGLPQTNRYQDKDALLDVLYRINAGEDVGSVQVPTDARAEYPAPLSPGSGFGGGYGGGVITGSRVDYGGPSGGYGAGDAYLRQMYAENLNAQLAALRAAYEQSAADYRAHDDLIAGDYRARRNQAAAQNDLERMYMAEMGSMSGFNTGASGQLALAQSAAYQGSMADLLAAESQDRAANDLALQKLAAGYRGDVSAAQARSSTELLEALYSEAVRQEELAREEAWRREQLEYQRQQDDLDRQYRQAQWEYGLQADRREAAYDLASTMLKNGILPDSATLAAAGIAQSDAAAMVRAYRTPARSVGKSAGSGTSSAGAQDYSGLFNAAYSSGTPSSYIANNYKKYGFSKSTGLSKEYEDWAGDSGKLNSAIQNVNRALTNGNQEAAHGYIKSVWDSLSGREREQLQNVLSKYGIHYTR